MTPRLGFLLEEHDRLRELFMRHQIALICADGTTAAEHLDKFDRLIRTHMDLEERLLIPLIREPRAGGSADLYLAEHRKIRESLGEIRRRLAEWNADPPRTLELLDFEWTFKNLLEHHDLRERRGLYRELEANLTAQELSALIRQLR